MDISVLNRLTEQIKSIASTENAMLGVTTGFAPLDERTGGLMPGQLVTLGGLSGMGKSALMLSMLLNMGKAGVPSLLFSSEMKEEDVMRRALSQVSGVPLKQLSRGPLGEAFLAACEGGMAKLQKLPLHMSKLTRLHVDEIMSQTREAVQKLGVRVVAVDYVQNVYNEARSWESRYAEMNVIVRQMKTLAMELNITILLVSQLSKNALTRGSDRPQLIDLRDSGTIADDSDIVLLLHRPEYFNVTVDENTGASLRGVAEVILAKNRYGRTGAERIGFDEETLTFKLRQEPDPSIRETDETHYESISSIDKSTPGDNPFVTPTGGGEVPF